MNRKLRQNLLKDRDARGLHSHAYHRHFDGYVERCTLDEKGRRRIERVYAGTCLVQDVTPVQRVLLRVCHLSSLLAMLGLLALAAISQNGSGSAIQVVLPEIATVGVLFWMLAVILVEYVPSPVKLTIRAYRSTSTALKRASLALCGCFLMDAAMTLAWMLANPGTGEADAWLAAVWFAVAAGLALAMHFLERRVPYAEVGNAEAKPPDGVEIET